MIETEAALQLKYWPFEVLPPEKRSEQHQREIRFLESAYQEGFQSYEYGTCDLGANTSDRGGLIVVRGRSRWEVFLGTHNKRVLSAFLDDFAAAADAVLQWLRGADASAILARLENHLVAMPGAAHRFVLHDQTSDQEQR